MTLLIKPLFIVVFFVSGTVISQELLNLINSKKVTSITYFGEGDSRSYHFKTMNDRFKNDREKSESQVVTEYDIDLSVIEEADSFYIMEMIYSNFTVQTGQKKKSIEDEFSNLQDGMKIRYKTNNVGQFDTIINITELTAELEKQINLIKETFKDNVSDKLSADELKIVDTALEYFVKRFTTPENVEVLFLGDILTIHGYLGLEFTLDKPIDFEMSYPVFDEFELKGKGTALLTAISKEGDSFMINVNSAPSKEELEKYIKDIFESFTIGLNGKKEELSDFKITSKSKARYSFELSSGWPKIITETTTNTISTRREKIKTVSKTTVKMN